MKLSPGDRRILEANRELLEKNNFQDFFTDIPPKDRLIFAEFFYFDCDINFLKYMEYIPDNLFAFSTNLTNINIPNNIKSIYNTTFYSCPILKYVRIPNSVKTIARSAFEKCPNLTIGCKKGSYADKWASTWGIKIDYI